ncbi:hypothetical protein M378DRAFT_12141 [Amanita muscaria Koide BX008]|uniref:Uncharacterized protein n=1 Tax=Amanita muscaria (strain Koide BX008) TaxID=946122 RepID=A0A0C2SJL7_AMAMK|nr:hypothetical protein M378DRAFT_12141 [Amanita muscaria Koide BX008]
MRRRPRIVGMTYFDTDMLGALDQDLRSENPTFNLEWDICAICKYYQGSASEPGQKLPQSGSENLLSSLKPPQFSTGLAKKLNEPALPPAQLPKTEDYHK